jgi:DNA recombination protein RmuC
MAGMLEHCDFIKQESVMTEEGLRRPDLIVKLAGGRQVVIDAKAPYSAYLDAHEAADDDARAAHLKRHAELVRQHMMALGRKAYWEQFSPTPEMVIMFLPGEMLFSAALQSDPTLIELGVQQKVVPATPTTLILALAPHYGWTCAGAAENAQRADSRASLRAHRQPADHWSDGAKARKAESYNKSVGTPERRARTARVSSRSRRRPRARRLCRRRWWSSAGRSGAGARGAAGGGGELRRPRTSMRGWLASARSSRTRVPSCQRCRPPG